MNYEKIGEFIQEKRKEKKLTQKELAKKLGVTDKAVSKWERGLGCPDVSILEVLSKELDVSILELLKGRKIENEVINVTEADDYIKSTITASKYLFILKLRRTILATLTFIVLFISGIIIFSNINNYHNLNKKEYISKTNRDITITNIDARLDSIKNNIDKLDSIKNKISLEDYEYLKNNLNLYYKHMKNLKIFKYRENKVNYNDVYKFYVDEDALSLNYSLNLYSIIGKYLKNDNSYELTESTLKLLFLSVYNSFDSDYNHIIGDTILVNENIVSVRLHYHYFLQVYNRQIIYVDNILNEFISEVSINE